MSEFTFPASDIDTTEALLAALGSLWEDTYLGNDLINSLCAAKAAQQRQAFQSGRELIDACSRQAIPVFHIEEWTELQLNESARNDADYTLMRFGDPGQFAADSPYQWGIPIDSPLHAWKLPQGLVAVPAIFNRITDSSLTLIDGIDYVLRDGHIIFRDDPFRNDLVPKASVFEQNVQVDRTLSLWVFRGSIDRHHVYRQFGYVLSLQLPSSEHYKQLVNALFDALVLGSTGAVFHAAWSAITGIPLAAGGETVEAVLDEGTRKLVITDKNVYTFDAAATVTVTAGQSLQQGDPLTDSLVFHEFNRGQVPAEVRSIAMGRGMLAAGYFGDLVFENEDVPLVVTTDSEGYTQLSWRLAGWPGDVAKFFDDLHANGRSRGQTLAHLLDQRPATVRDTEPTAGALPATINPFAFLCKNVLRNNAFMVRIRAAAAMGGVGMNAAKFLRRVIPPHTVMFVCVELELADDPVIMDGPGSDTRPGYEEALSLFLCQPMAETISPELVTEDLQFRRIGGRCT